MSINKDYFDKFIRTSEKAAIGAYPFIGKGDKNAADKGSVDMMRNELNKINMEGTVVIGEGEMDEAPMLYIGEKLGTLNGPKFDIAVDPLEGTKFTANGEPNAFSVLAISEKGGLLGAYQLRFYPREIRKLIDDYLNNLRDGNFPEELARKDFKVQEAIDEVEGIKATADELARQRDVVRRKMPTLKNQFENPKK